MSETSRAVRPEARRTTARRLPTVLVGTALFAALAGAPAGAQRSGGDVVLDSTTTAPYRQRAAEGRRTHDFSPRTPPRNGRFVYGHWTPYDPPNPDSYPADARKHVIARGDTLWDIAGKYYGDNLLWPYIWEANPWVTFPHWIYPGDVLLVAPLMVLPEGSLQADAKLPSILADYFPGGGYDSVHCGHFLADPNKRFFGEVIAGEDDPTPIMFSRGSVVYVNVGAKDGVLPGDDFAIAYPREHFGINAAERDWMDDQVHHPVTGEKMGEVIKMVGRLKIILLGEEVSTAMIDYACDGVEVGYKLWPFDEIAVPLVRRKDRERYFNEMPRRGRGFVVWNADRAVTGAPGQLLSIDLGSRDGVIPGDVFRVYRHEPHDQFAPEIEHVGDFWDFQMGKRRMKQRRDETDKVIYGKQRPVPIAPPRVIGSIVVLYTEQESATARAFNTTSEFYMGDSIVYEPVDTGLTAVAVVEERAVPQVRPLLGEEGEEGDKENTDDRGRIRR